MNKVIILFFTLANLLLFKVQSIQTFDLADSIARGKKIYLNQCANCHLDDGTGILGVFPPLANSDYLMADKARSIRQVLYGVSGSIVVNGVTYNNEMPAFPMSDEEVSDVLNYVRNTWGNEGKAITPADVRRARRQ